MIILKVRVNRPFLTRGGSNRNTSRNPPPQLNYQSENWYHILEVKNRGVGAPSEALENIVTFSGYKKCAHEPRCVYICKLKYDPVRTLKIL